MARNSPAQQDLFTYLVDGHAICPADSEGNGRITIERLVLHLGHLSGVRLVLGRVHALSTIRRRQPIYLLPPRRALFVNRATELETLRQSVLPRHVVDLHGPDGAGKSALAAALTHEFDLKRFPDGTVYVTGPIQYPDLIQALFDCFYESDTPVKIALCQSHTYLSNLRTLVVLDDVGLGPKQIDPVLDALQEAAVLVVGPDRTALGRGRAVRLKGLPRQEAVTLFKQVADAKPSVGEFPIIDQICILLNDMPLPITSIAAQAVHSKQTLTQLVKNLQGRKPWAGPGADPSVGPSLEEIVLILDATDRRLLSLVAAFPKPGASSEALRRMMNLPLADFQLRVERLQELQLLCSVGQTQQVFASRTNDIIHPRLTLVSAYYETVRSWLVDDAARREVVSYYATRLSRGDRLAGDELPGLLGAIEDCAHYGWLDYLELLVRTADRNLAQLRWWAEWQHVLDVARRCAQAEGDRDLEAWAAHQLGSLLGALSDFDRAFHLLRTALSMRQALGDQTGAAMSAHNLEVLEQLAPVPVVEQTPPASGSPEPREKPEEPAPEPQSEAAVATSPTSVWRARRIRLRLALLAAVLILLMGAVVLQYTTRIDSGENTEADFAVSWEFGDAWNSLHGNTWTQQIKIVVAGGDGSFNYFVDGQPAAEMFEVVLPLCEGAQGTIRAESTNGQSAEVQFEFDSPYCH
jgi:hypothetical protein